MPGISEKLGLPSVDSIGNLVNNLSVLSFRKLLLGFLWFVVIIFLILFAYTSFCFFAVEKLPLTKAGLYIFRPPIVSGFITPTFYHSVTARVLGLFLDEDEVKDPYPNYIFPVSGELYSGRFLYAGRAEICGEKTAPDRVCLKFKSGKVIQPIFIDGISLVVNFRRSLGQDYSLKSTSLGVGTKVEVFLQSDISPQRLLRGKDVENVYFDVREMKILD